MMDLEIPIEEMESLALARAFVGLAKIRADMKEHLAGVENRMQAIEFVLRQRFERDHVQKLHVDGMTVYLQHQLHAKAKEDKGQAVDALKASGLEALVHETFDDRTLSAVIRERRDEFEAAEKRVLSPQEILDRLPEPLQDTLTISEITRLRTRKGD